MASQTSETSLAPINPAASNQDEAVLFEGRPAVLPHLGAWLLAILTVGLAAIYYWLRTLNKHYRVTTQRIIVEHGLLSKRMEQTDLYRIVDFVVERPFLQRLVGTGNLVVKTLDGNHRTLSLYGLSVDAKELYERLRKATDIEKRKHNVRVVDYE